MGRISGDYNTKTTLFFALVFLVLAFTVQCHRMEEFQRNRRPENYPERQPEINDPICSGKAAEGFYNELNCSYEGIKSRYFVKWTETNCTGAIIVNVYEKCICPKPGNKRQEPAALLFFRAIRRMMKEVPKERSSVFRMGK